MPVLAGSVLVACAGARSTADIPAIVSAVPFADGERLTYALHDGTGATVGRGTFNVRREGDRLQLQQSYETVAGDGQPPRDTTAVTVDPATLRPHALARLIRRADRDDRYAASYAADGQSVGITNNDEQPRTVKLPQPVYDNESSLWLWRAAPLAEDYRATYVSMNAVERVRQTVELTVTSRQRIEVPAGAFETWRLQVRSGRATHVAWINVEAPHHVVQWDNGALVFKLESAR